MRITGGESATQAIRSWLGVPIPRRGEGIGLLEVDSTEVAAFDDADVELLLTVARALAGPIDLAARYAAERRSRHVRDAFSGMVSHELRTPITTIFGMSQVLRQRHAALAPSDREQLIVDIESEADRLRRLVEDLLILGRAEGGRFDLDREPIILAHLIARAVADEGRRWPAHTLESAVERTLPIVVGEEVYVEQVVRNLLSNAAKYSPAGTRVSVVAEEEGSSVAVRVLDEGMGLPDKDADQLFELYFRAPEATRQAAGAGIGLFVCRTLVEAMGGRMWAKPRETGGSEFGFTLPIDPDA